MTTFNLILNVKIDDNHMILYIVVT